MQNSTAFVRRSRRQPEGRSWVTMGPELSPKRELDAVGLIHKTENYSETTFFICLFDQSTANNFLT